MYEGSTTQITLSTLDYVSKLTWMGHAPYLDICKSFKDDLTSTFI